MALGGQARGLITDRHGESREDLDSDLYFYLLIPSSSSWESGFAQVTVVGAGYTQTSDASS